MKRFLTMAYILAVNASTLSDSGAMCTGPLRRVVPSDLGLFRLAEQRAKTSLAEMNGDGGVRRLQQGWTAVNFLSCKHRPRRNVHGSLLTCCSSGGCNAARDNFVVPPLAAALPRPSRLAVVCPAPSSTWTTEHASSPMTSTPTRRPSILSTVALARWTWNWSSKNERKKRDTLGIEVHREGRHPAVAASVSNTDYSGDAADNGLTLGCGFKPSPTMSGRSRRLQPCFLTPAAAWPPQWRMAGMDSFGVRHKTWLVTFTTSLAWDGYCPAAAVQTVTASR